MPRVRGRDLRVLYDAPAIAARNVELAHEIALAGYVDLLVVSILKGSFIFAADLIRALHTAGLAPEVEFLTLSSYRSGTESTGEVAVLRDIETDVAGRDVLLIDDILESGRTLAFAKDLMLSRKAHRVGIAVLLEKPGKLAAAAQGRPCRLQLPRLFRRRLRHGRRPRVSRTALRRRGRRRVGPSVLLFCSFPVGPPVLLASFVSLSGLRPSSPLICFPVGLRRSSPLVAIPPKRRASPGPAARPAPAGRRAGAGRCRLEWRDKAAWSPRR